MPNIYLRLPRSRCQFFRNRSQKEHLLPNEPLVFNRYTTEFTVMRNSLTNAPARMGDVNQQCFSHQQWANMMNGRPPGGGKPVMKRQKGEYLTYAEVTQLCGRTDYNKSANDDYLCIKLPSEVEIVDTVYHVTPSWNLDQHGVFRLSECLRNDFKRSLIEWALATFDFCTSGGRVVCRSQTAMLERFLMRYDIDPTPEERDSLRRVVERWITTEQKHFSAYSCFDMQYTDEQEKVHRIDKFIWE